MQIEQENMLNFAKIGNCGQNWDKTFEGRTYENVKSVGKHCQRKEYKEECTAEQQISFH